MTTDIQPYQGGALDGRLRFAETLAQASLLPRAYQHQPGNVLLAMELGDALGIRPIQAITGVHVIDGKPTASADLIASLIRRAGHKLRVSEEQTADGPRVTATLIRADDPGFPFTAVWDRAKAKAAGLHGKGNWARYEGQMMRNRAVTEVGRMGASDALYGVIYTPDELGASVDERGDVVEAEVVSVTTAGAPPALPADIIAGIARIESLDDLRAAWSGMAGHMTPDVEHALRARAEQLQAAEYADQADEELDPSAGAGGDRGGDVDTAWFQLVAAAGAAGMTEPQLREALEAEYAQPVEDLDANQLGKFTSKITGRG